VVQISALASPTRVIASSLQAPRDLGRRTILADDPLGQLLNGGFGRALVEGDHAFFDEVDLVADVEDPRVIVGDDDRRDFAAVLQSLDEVEDQRRFLCPRRGGGFLEQERFRLLETERAMATAWRCLPDNLATSTSTEGPLTFMRSSVSIARRRVWRSSTIPSAPPNAGSR
jgi:hypothetical protein